VRRVYLAGAIFHAPGAAEWRKVASGLFGVNYPGQWDVRDPCVFEIDISDPAKLVDTDLREIAMCHVVLAKVDRPSWGTPMELFYATARHIPVIGWMPDMLAPRGPWLLRHVTQFEPTLEMAVAAAAQRALP
jgi:nucleoside 2-deoxyribosyltransferase